MRPITSRQYRLLWAVIALCPLAARADGIDLPIVAGMGIGVAVPLLTFNVVVEGLILSRFIGTRFRDLWRPMLAANVWSLVAGIPICILNAMVAETFLPSEMVARMGKYPLAISLGVVNYYVVTVLVELWALSRSGIAGQSKTPLLKGLLVGHLAAYAVLGPGLVWYATPKHTVRTFVEHSQWAAQPATPIVYVSPKGQLQTVLSDGGGSRILVTNEVRDFVVAPDLSTILCRGASNSYFLARAGTVQLVTAERLQCYGEGMDFSPDGRFVALINEASALWLWDGRTGKIQKRSLPTQDPCACLKLVWSTSQNVFYVAAGSEQMRGTIDEAGMVDLSPATKVKRTELASHYGRIGQRNRDADDWDAPTDWRYRDGDRSFFVEHGLGNGIIVHCGKESLTISDNPGVFHFGDRRFTQAAFAANQNELLFGDGQHLYLADIPGHRVGLVTAGRRFVLMSAPFSKAEHFAD